MVDENGVPHCKPNGDPCGPDAHTEIDENGVPHCVPNERPDPKDVFFHIVTGFRASQRPDGMAYLTEEEARFAWYNYVEFHGLRPAQGSFRHVFHHFDVNANGELNVEEFMELYNLWTSGDVAGLLMFFFDTTGDRLIDHGEFDHAWNDVTNTLTEDPCTDGPMPWPAAEDAWHIFMGGENHDVPVGDHWDRSNIESVVHWVHDCTARM